MAHGDEVDAFRSFGETFPAACTLLIDTYDTVQGARNAIASGAPMQGVRLDSGDLLSLSKEVRKVLDEGGQRKVKIVASGDLNEYKIDALLKAGAPLDIFGVGTELVTSRDEPTLSTVYKLVEQATPAGTLGRFKMSQDKKTYPFAKQVFRQEANGKFAGDVVARAGEQQAGSPLLVKVMEAGKLVAPLPGLGEIQERCRREVSSLPAELLDLEKQAAYPVRFSDDLERAVREGHMGTAR
jgi:nicotinate phosphoribosyltransferase